MKLDTPNQLSRATLALHWVVGLTMIGLLALGVYMVELETRSLYFWHKSFGFVIFFVIVMRVVWRLKNGWPTPVGEYRHIQHLVAKSVHWALLLGSIFMPISGFLMSSLGGHGVEVFGLEIVTRNPDPENPRKVLPYNEAFGILFHSIHHWLGYFVIATLALHISGALKHHLVDKDSTLKRMLGAKI